MRLFRSSRKHIRKLIIVIMSTKYMESEFQRDDNNRHQSLRQIHKKHEQGSFLSKLKVLNTIDQTCNSTIETIESQRKIFVLKHVDLDPYATAYTEVKCLLLLQHQTHGKYHFISL